METRPVRLHADSTPHGPSRPGRGHRTAPGPGRHSFNANAWPWWQYQPGKPAVQGNEVNAIPAKVMKCPSDPRSELRYAALTDYLGVNGRDQFQEDGGQNGILYVNAGVRMTAITDGTSNTVLVGERPPSYTNLYGWMWAGSGDSPYFGTTDVVLGVRECVNMVPNGTRDFYRPGKLDDPSNVERFHFWALHPGGGNWLLADGSVRFITYSSGTATAGTFNGISGVTVLECLASRADGEVFTLN